MMNVDQFRHYLRHLHHGCGMAEKTVESRIANCLRVERFEENLDELFERDGLQGLLSRLEYSTDDQRASRALRHKIPIDGDWRNGSATLKAAVMLYRAFRQHQLQPTSQNSAVTPSEPRPTTPLQKSLSWPVWDIPSQEETLKLARIVARHARFLRPDIVQAIVEDNERHQAAWSGELAKRGIDPLAYLWPGSACAFPGVRRYAGSSEIAVFRKRAQGSIEDALALDDNDYPKQVWSFVLTGKKFPKHGPEGYALAHLADHKVHKNRAEADFRVVDGADKADLHGLYTSPTNTAYLPVATIRPTDFNLLLRNLLKRRAADLYGGFCAPLPPWLEIRPAVNSDWNLDLFEWPEPVGDPAWVRAFLEFRREKMEELFRGAPTNGPEARCQQALVDELAALVKA